MLDQIITDSGLKFDFGVDRLRVGFEEKFGRHPKVTKENQGLIGRVKRSLSWIERAHGLSNTCIEFEGDLQGQFIALWIAFNALYAHAGESRTKEMPTINAFLRRLVEIDGDDRSISAALQTHKNKVHGILRDEFLCDEYWNTKLPIATIREDLGKQLHDCYAEKGRPKVEILLGALFDRLYFLRNLVFHGNTTDRRSPIKDSLRSAADVLDILTRVFIAILVRKGNPRDWNPLPFPWKDSPQHPRH